MNVMKFPVKTFFADLEHPIIILTISNTRKHIYKFMLLHITNLSTIKHGFKITVLVYYYFKNDNSNANEEKTFGGKCKHCICFV